MLTVPFAGALVAAACFGVASVLQHASAARADVGRALDIRLFGRLGRQGPYLLGLALDGVGFALTAWTVRLLPLFVVQAALASALAVTAVVAGVVAREALRPAERLAVAGIVGGLVLLGLSAAPGRTEPGRGMASLLLVAGIPGLVLLAVWVERRPSGTRPGMALGALSGLAFAGFGMTGRVMAAPPHPAMVVDPLAWAVVAYVALGLLLFAAALQRGRVTTITAACVVTETLVPAAVGVLALGDGARPGLAGVAATGFALTTAAALWLARAGTGAAAVAPALVVEPGFVVVPGD